MDRLRSKNRVAATARSILAVVAYVLVVETLFHPPADLFIKGIAIGALYGLIATGVILIYRTNRIINFAAAGIGAIPAVTAVLLQVRKGMPYAFGIPIVVIGGLGLGALVDMLIVRRFAKAPRLILTVATLGVVQILAFIAIYIPIWLGSKGKQTSVVATPWKRFSIANAHGTPVLTGDQIFAVAVVIAMSLGLAAFFRYTRMGIALRASAENADRASLLGIPVRRVGTVSWMLAGLFGAVTIFLRASLVGVPTDGTLGFGVLLFVLAAVVIARMENIPLALAAGMGVGVLEESSVFKTGSNDFSSAIMLGVVLLALLFQRGQLSRAYDSGVSTWQSVKEFRPIPAELRDIKEVVSAKSAVWLIVVVLALGAPFLVTPGQIGKLTLIPIYAIVAVSMVVLTGWAGQISLGQFGLVGAGAAVAGGLAADHNIDFFAALVIGIAAGAALATVIGLPALRVPGLYLAVTTLAFGGAMQFYFLNRRYWIGQHVLPHGEASRILRPMLLQRIDLTNDRSYYWLCLVFLSVALLAARSFRHNRSGRILIAVRDNQRAAPAYAINLARTKLAAFAISGGLAAMAGVLLAYQQRSVDASTYGIVNSILIFLIAVIGGLTSLPGAVVGTVVIQGIYLLVEPHFKGAGLLATGPGLLLILLFLPGGFAQGLHQSRDSFLRWVAKRHGILVPSLLADRRETDPLDADVDVVAGAEHHVEEVDSFDVFGSTTITCPVCRESFTPEAASGHEHFRPASTDEPDAPAGADGTAVAVAVATKRGRR